MDALSSHVSMGAVDSALQEFSNLDNFEGIDAVLSNLQTDQIESLVPFDSRVSIRTDGNDYVYNAGSKLSIHGLDGNDTIHGSSGDTHIFGDDGNDVLYDYRGGDDTLYGGAGNDRLSGGAGNDLLYGGDGNDILTGGAGADTFLFHQDDSGIDRIYYADARQGDRLDISDFLDQYDPIQDSIDDFVILSDNGFSTTVSIDADGQGAGEAVQIATLYGSSGAEVDGIIDLNALGIV